LLTITAATTLGATVTPFTQDRSKYTMHTINFTAPENIYAGVHQNYTQNGQAILRIEYPVISSSTILFPYNMGSNNTANRSTMPCYGIYGLTRKFFNKKA
jgi:hypothetical protein